MNWLVVLRKAHGIRTQQELSYRLGVSRTTVSYWETGIARPTYQHQEKIAQLFGLDVRNITELVS